MLSSSFLLSMNSGKIFENDFKKSAPDWLLVYRLPDAAQSFGRSNNLRFSRKNPFDFLLWDSIGRNLFAVELKTVSGKSISFERSKEESKEIHYHQIIGLKEWSRYKNTICGFIIEFRAIEKTVFLKIEDFLRLISIITKKSFTIQDLEEHNIPYLVVPQCKLRTHYKYDVDFLIKNFRQEEFLCKHTN